MREARRAVADLAAALSPDGSPLGAMAGPATQAAAAACRILADLLDASCAPLPDDPAELATWAATGSDLPATLVRRAQLLLPRPGLDLDAPPPGFVAMARRLAADAQFGLLPEAGGGAADPGPLHRLPDAERSGCATLGPVAGRLAALLYDARHAARRLRRTDVVPPAAILLEDGWGAGMAATARGPLVQALRLSGDRIVEFRSAAPTEWLLHRDGALLRCLAALPEGTAATELRIAVAAFDPCAPVVVAAESRADA